MIDERLVISFSGGRTSGLMLRRLLDNPTHLEVVTLFANTSQEDERTLEFVDRVEPTPEMVEAWKIADLTFNPENPPASEEWQAQADWKAMLAASPTPPKEK